MKLSSCEIGTVTVLSPREAIVQSECDELRCAMADVATSGSGRIVLDLSEVSFIDSVGLELICSLQTVCSENGGRLKLAAVGEICSEILRVTDLSKQFEILPSVEEAAKSMA